MLIVLKGPLPSPTHPTPHTLSLGTVRFWYLKFSGARPRTPATPLSADISAVPFLRKASKQTLCYHFGGVEGSGTPSPILPLWNGKRSDRRDCSTSEWLPFPFIVVFFVHFMAKLYSLYLNVLVPLLRTHRQLAKRLEHQLLLLFFFFLHNYN